MATQDKDFKVKKGLQVAEGGSFGAAVVVGSPTQNNHAATKLYVDQNSGGGGGIVISETPPESPSEGNVWFESDTTRKYIWYDSYWVETAAPVSAIGLLDGGAPDSNYGGIATIDAGGVG